MIEFKYQFSDEHPEVTVKMSAEAILSDVVEQFELFLKAAGYEFEGYLDFVDEEEYNENKAEQN